MSHTALKTVPQEPTTARKVNNGRGQAAGTRGCQDVAPAEHGADSCAHLCPASTDHRTEFSPTCVLTGLQRQP